MKLSEYTKCSSGTQVFEGKDLNLSVLEAQFVNSFTRIEITGKKGRTVPVLLTSRMKAAMDLLVERRPKMDIPITNPYVFCITTEGSCSYIRGCDVLRHFSSLCGAKRPEAIRSTTLRKHVATMTQVMNLHDNEPTGQ